MKSEVCGIFHVLKTNLSLSAYYGLIIYFFI